MAVGNTFGATALSSYGGFWLSFAIILTPGGFEIEKTLMATSKSAFADEFGLYLMVSFPTNPTEASSAPAASPHTY
jgi:succinate-acetate transporter protein